MEVRGSLARSQHLIFCPTTKDPLKLLPSMQQHATAKKTHIKQPQMTSFQAQKKLS